MKIGLDFDGVISDCGRLKSDCAKSLYGVNIPGSQFKRGLVIGNGWLTAEQYQEITKAVYYPREVDLLIEPVDGMLSYMSDLLHDGHNVLAITSRRDTELEIAKEWAIGQGLALEFVGVGYRNDKAHVATGDAILNDIRAGRRSRFQAALDQIHLAVARAGIKRKVVKEAIRKVRGT